MRQILNVNTALLEHVELEMENWPYTNVASQILTTGPFFKLYTPYVQGYDEAIATLNSATSQNPQLSQFIQRECKHQALKGLTLQSLLIMPVQRSKLPCFHSNIVVPRYVLLLKSLLDCTPKEHSEYETIKKAIDITRHVSTHVNDEQREYEFQKSQTLLKFVDFERRRGTNLRQTHRHFKRHCDTVIVECLSLQCRYSFQLSLFSDVLFFMNFDDTSFIGSIYMAFCVVKDNGKR